MKPTLIASVLVVALALTLASTASATSFHLSKPGTVILKGEGNQVFTPGNGKGKLECEEIGAKTKVSEELVSSIVALVKFSKCEAFGTTSTITTGDILFDANGSTTLPDTDKFIISSATGKCSVLIQSTSETSPGTSLFGTVKFTNNTNGTVTATADLSGLSALIHGAKGSICGEPDELTSATLESDFELSLSGGAISVK
jgi:hypothetical protein